MGVRLFAFIRNFSSAFIGFPRPAFRESVIRFSMYPPASLYRHNALLSQYKRYFGVIQLCIQSVRLFVQQIIYFGQPICQVQYQRSRVAFSSLLSSFYKKNIFKAAFENDSALLLTKMGDYRATTARLQGSNLTEMKDYFYGNRMVWLNQLWGQNIVFHNAHTTLLKALLLNSYPLTL